MAEHTPAPNPTRGIYGFVVFLLFKTLFILYTFWAFVPTNFFENYLGITYLPDKYFAVFVPILVLTATNLFAFLIYPSLTWIATPNLDDKSTILDEYSVRRCKHRDSHEILCDQKIVGKCLENQWDSSEFCDFHENG
jgi:phosphatidylinositol glycan class P protein